MNHNICMLEQKTLHTGREGVQGKPLKQRGGLWKVTWMGRLPLQHFSLFTDFTLDSFFLSELFNDFLCFSKKIVFLGSLRTSLLCKVGELAGGGSVAVCISDRWQVTGDRLWVTWDRWQMARDRWHFKKKIIFVLMLLCTHVERFSVSRMWNFLITTFSFLNTLRYWPEFWTTCLGDHDFPPSVLDCNRDK